jgi:tetratricopeptide (TPR) repeat protein
MLRLVAAFCWLLYAASVCAQAVDPQILFQQATAAQQRGDDSTAVRIYTQLLQSHPEAIAVRVNLGAAFAKLKRFDEAIEQYRAVLSKDPHNLPVRLNLALAYEGKGDLLRAVRELEFVHRSEPSNLQASMLLAEGDLRLERYSDVVSLLSPLETALPNDLDLAWILGSALIRCGRTDEGLQRVDRVAEKGPSAEAYLLAGQTRVQRDEYASARQDVDAAYRLNPALSGVQTLNGMILEHTGDYDGAEVALNAAIKENPSDFNAHLYLGAILYFKRNLAGAREHLQRAIQLSPGAVQPHYELALVARAEGNSDEAVHELEIVTRKNPNWMQPHVELSALYYRLQRPIDGARERQIVDRLVAAHGDRPAASTP